ncbi:hypothetical protein Taro_049661 [Colocasia esculenta]|uniref:HSA domain-containing protein n=1 Tax=Colocasia esculenta TaxID=4460 RepID=A0A843XBC9_COLES|nr:hypothetical protein [Colocasia esculenta]
MYGDSPGFSVLVNTEVDSMGGVIDDGVDLQDKTSPRRAAIDKVQAELRQEYYVREERKRELEFLEKGGNPLDFKFGPTTPVSIQSTSLTDQLLDYDAKGSSALVASPHGDSVDSSIRPGAALGREPNTADNLLLIDGQNSNHDGTKNEMRSARRKPIASSEHSSKQDGSNVKESEESGVFRFGVKSQAYARRNRSRPSRDNAYLGSAHVASSTHGNNSSLFPSSVNSRDKKNPLLETQVEENAVSSVSNSKPASPSGNNLFRALDIDDQVEMEIDASEAQETSGLMLKADVREGEAEVMTSNHLQQNGCNENAKAADQQCSNGTISLPCELTVGEALLGGAATEPIVTDENTGNTMKSSPVCSKNVVDLQNQDQIDKHPGGQIVDEALASKDVDTEPSNANSSADLHGGQGLKPECDGTLIQDGHAIEKSDPNTIDVHSVGDEEPSSLSRELVNSHVQVKHEELTDSKVHLQSEGRHELAQKEGKLENSSCDTTSADPKGLCPPSGLPVNVCGPSNPNLCERTSSATSQLPLVPGKNLRLSKKACEDAILKEARIIEARLKRVNELSLCNFPSEKRRKSHWDYVIEEMAWLANDFTQERIWKITAASQISRFIASSGRLKFEKENLCRKQRKAAHSMAKAVMSFWQLAEVLRTGGKSNADMEKEYYSSLFVSWKSRGRDAAKKQVEVVFGFSFHIIANSTQLNFFLIHEH